MESQETQPKVMIIGLGQLGKHVLDMFVRTHPGRRVILAGRDQEYLHRKANLTRFGASQLDVYPEVSYEVLDLRDIERTAEALARLKPEIIFNAASLQSWWVITTLPKEVFNRLDQAQFGPWLPMHLTLVQNLMKAVKQSGINAKVVNAAFPDAVNAVLHKRGLGPTVGIGNVANVVPALRVSVATALSAPLRDVQVSFAAQHYVSHILPRTGDAGGAPYCFRAYARGIDRTSDLDIAQVFARVGAKLRRVGGIEGQILTASSATMVLRAMADDSGVFLHAPGPLGLPGGYPLRMNATGPVLALPEGISEAEAIGVNEAGQRADGIDAIEEDGTVCFGEKNMAIMKSMIGYACPRMPAEDSAFWAEELGAKFKAFRSRFP